MTKYRTLVRVADVDGDRAWLVIPAWNPRETVYHVSETCEQFTPGQRLHAHVNLAAETAAELDISDWEFDEPKPNFDHVPYAQKLLEVVSHPQFWSLEYNYHTKYWRVYFTFVRKTGAYLDSGLTFSATKEETVAKAYAWMQEFKEARDGLSLEAENR